MRVRLEGALTLGAVETLLPLVQPPAMPLALEVDLSSVRYMDTGALAWLLYAAAQADLRVCGAGAELRRVLAAGDPQRRIRVG